MEALELVVVGGFGKAKAESHLEAEAPLEACGGPAMVVCVFRGCSAAGPIVGATVPVAVLRQVQVCRPG